MIFMILKIIGIVLLIILGILIAAVTVLLFVPIRYRIQGSKDEVMTGRARVSWLLHILAAEAVYENQKLVTKIRIFGFPFKDSSRPEKPKRKTKKKKAAPSEETFLTQTESAEKDGHSTKQEEEKREEEKGYRQPRYEQETDGAKGKENLFQKGKRFLKAVWNFLRNIRYTIRGFCDKIKNAVSKFQWYKDVWESDECQKAYALCKRQLGKVIHNIKPGKFQLRVRMGFDDPSVTGQILAAYSMIYPWVYESITVEPDFENSVLEGELFIKGRATLFVILKAAWKLYFDKNIRKIRQLFEEGGNENV